MVFDGFLHACAACNNVFIIKPLLYHSIYFIKFMITTISNMWEVCKFINLTVIENSFLIIIFFYIPTHLELNALLLAMHNANKCVYSFSLVFIYKCCHLHVELGNFSDQLLIHYDKIQITIYSVLNPTCDVNSQM